MRCARCAGMRVPELITEGGARALALRCVLCGDVTDPVIAINRRQPPYIPQGRARTAVYGNRSRVGPII
ncbi:MAG: hypothetical protein QM706_12520 [Nitrospira sp.]